MMRQFYKPRYLSKEKLKKVVQEEAAPFGAALHYIVIVMWKSTENKVIIIIIITIIIIIIIIFEPEVDNFDNVVTIENEDKEDLKITLGLPLEI